MSNARGDLSSELIKAQGQVGQLGQVAELLRNFALEKVDSHIENLQGCEQSQFSRQRACQVIETYGRSD